MTNKSVAELIENAELNYLSTIDKNIAMAQAERAQVMVDIMEAASGFIRSSAKKAIKLVGELFTFHRKPALKH